MTIEERMAVAESKMEALCEKDQEQAKELKELKDRFSEVRFKMRIIWGSLVTIFSALGLAFLKLLMDW